jgi:hypothetical protein
MDAPKLANVAPVSASASRRRVVKLLVAGLAGGMVLTAGRRGATLVAQEAIPAGSPVPQPPSAPAPAPAAVPSTCTNYVLSGGPSPGDPIHVDDDLTVLVNDAPIFVDRDGELNVFAPIHFQATPGDQLTVVARDAATCGRKIGALWLHCADGGEPRFLTGGQDLGCNPDRLVPENFYRESWRI